MDALRRDVQPPPRLKRDVKRALVRRGLIREPRSFPRLLGLAAAAIIVFALGVRVGGARSAPAPEDDATPRWALLLYGDSAGTSDAIEAARVAEYRAWARDLAGQGIMVEGVKLADAGSALIEGPFAARPSSSASEVETTAVRGFFIIRAATEAEALRLARNCPHLRHGGRIAVRPIVPT